jgi:hypothetical protein
MQDQTGQACGDQRTVAVVTPLCQEDKCDMKVS